MPTPRTLHLISHTHWDREWYQSRERLRLRLVDLIDHLLAILAADPDFAHFHLDSQTVVLEDYLEVRPDRRAELAAHIQAGRIEVGPWYVLNDTFLTSGEATIRNLLLGTRQAAAFGRTGRIGYLPDQFGNAGQLPQIFAGFGIENAVVGRGITAADVPLEFVWRAPDGSGVLCTLLHGWYNNAQRLDAGPERAAEQLRRAAAHLQPHARTPHLLMMNGVDHLEAQENLSPILRAAAPLLAPDTLVHSRLDDYFAGVRRQGDPDSFLPAWRGEMRQQPHRHLVLNGTLSARTYLKIANHLGQLALERLAEPWCAAAALEGEEVPRAQLWTAWRYLLRNHPHDSICGCSVDAVHQDMRPRFRHSLEIARELTRRARVWLGQRIPHDGVALAVWNGAAHARDGLCCIALDFPPDSRGERLRLRDAESGREVPCHVYRQGPASRLVTDPVALPRAAPCQRVQVAFLARDVPGLGYRTLLAERVPGSRYTERPPADEGLRVLPRGGENEHVRLEVAPDGTFSLTARGRAFPGLGLLVDDGEAGDEYLHEPPAADRVVVGFSGQPTVSLAEFGPDWLTWSVAGTLSVPPALTPDRQARAEGTVPLPVEMRLHLVRGCPRLEMEVRLDNRARDHRLRLLLPTGLAPTESRAAGQFDVVARPTRLPAGWEAQGNHPMDEFVDVADPEGRWGLAVLPGGLAEYAVLDGGILAITLLRCTDVVGDNPGFDRAPEGQCPGPLAVRLALLPHLGPADLHAQAEELRLPPDAVQLGLPPEARRFVQDPPFVPPDPEPTLPPVHGFLHVDIPGAVLSAFRPAEDGRGVIVRLFNPTERTVEGALGLDRPLAQAHLCRLDERDEAPLPPAGREVALRLEPKRIVTVRLEAAVR